MAATGNPGIIPQLFPVQVKPAPGFSMKYHPSLPMKANLTYFAATVCVSSLSFLAFHNDGTGVPDKAPHEPKKLSTHSAPPPPTSTIARSKREKGIPEDDATGIVNRLTMAQPEEVIQIADEWIAGGPETEASLIAALKETEASAIKATLANMLGRIGSDAAIQAGLNAATEHSDLEGRMMIINGLTSGVEKPSAAGFLATAALVTSDPVLLFPVVETVSRCGDLAAFHDLEDLRTEPSTTHEQKAVLDQMIDGIRNRIGVCGISGGPCASPSIR